MMFGYASNETEDYMPLALDLAHKILIELAALRRENKAIKYLRRWRILPANLYASGFQIVETAVVA